MLLCSDPDEHRLMSHVSQIRGLAESGLDETRLLEKCAHHRLEPYVGCPRADLPIAEHLYRTLINLPSSAHLA